MLRLTLPGIADLLLVDDPTAMRWLNQHPHVTRELSPSAGLVQRVLGQRFTRDLRFAEGLLPVFLGRASAYRELRRKELEQRWSRNPGAPGEETRTLVAYVAGAASEAELQVAAQQWCGRLFGNEYQATAATYRAGERIAAFPSLDPLRAALGKKLGLLARAKSVLTRAAGHDLHCVHATSIGMLNVVHSLQAMRRLAADDGASRLSTRRAVLRSLSAPPVALRGCREGIDAPFLDAPLTRDTLVVFLLRRMYERERDTELAFMASGWSACPARRAVIDMLANVWDSAAIAQERVSQPPAAAKRAVSRPPSIRPSIRPSLPRSLRFGRMRGERVIPAAE